MEKAQKDIINRLHNNLKESETRIKQSKQALGYTTTQGLSTAFNQRYKNTNNKWIMLGFPLGALLFLVASICLGIWLTAGDEISISALIVRISLIPILLSGSFFCASQYTRQKRIAEDYAYKAVLTESLVGFSEQLSNEQNKGEEYTLYIKTVLSQLLVDPQRKHTLSRREENESTK